MVETTPRCGHATLGEVNACIQGPCLPVRSAPEVTPRKRTAQIAGLQVLGVGRKLAAMLVSLNANGRRRDKRTPVAGNGAHTARLTVCLRGRLAAGLRPRWPCSL